MKNILKRTFLVLVAIICMIAVTGCNNPKNDEVKTIEVVDMVGDKVTVPMNPKKVACVSRTTYDLLIAYGLGDKIDGAYKGTLNNPWVPVIYPESKNHFIYGYQDSYETFISRGVDLVFAPEQYIAKDLRDHGVCAVCVSLYGVPQFDEYVTFLSDLVVKLWDSKEVKEKAEAWNNSVKTAIDTVKEELAKHELPKQKVFYVRGDKDKGVGYTDTKCAFSEFAYRTLGFEFIGASMQTNKPSAEEVIASNPDIFVCGGIYQKKNIERLHQEPYCNLDAVKNNKIYSIPIGLTAFEQLSAMTPIFFYDQANKIYPEYFNFDIAPMVKSTIKDYFGFELSDKQVGYMLDGLNPEGEPLV